MIIQSAERRRWKLQLFALALFVGSCRGTWLDPGRQSKKDDPDADLIGTDISYHTCPPKTATCWCGSDEDRHVTIINMKQCPFSTSWGTQCEPCQTPKKLCRRLTKCARCARDNPQAICAACPPDRRGLHCDKEYPCKLPNITESMTVHPRFTRKGVYKLEFRCTEGRIRQGPRILKCLSHKTPAVWNKSPPTCESSPKCTLPPAYFGARTVDGTLVKSVYHVGENVIYQCKDGFDPITPDTHFNMTCVGKRWEGREPECVLKGCRKLTVDDGHVGYKGGSNSNDPDYAAVNAVATLSCNKGFIVQGSSEATCSESGSWEPSIPRCVAKNCHYGNMCVLNATLGDVIYLTNATEIYPGQTAGPRNVIKMMIGGERYYDPQVAFGCKEGSYRKISVGDVERTCFYNGTLSGSEIVCKRIMTCKIDTSIDPNLKFCRQSGTEPCTPGDDKYRDPSYALPHDVIPMGGRVRFSCSHYYRLLGNEVQHCREKLAIPSCVPECGIKRKHKMGLIRGGTKSTIKEWPWQAALLQRVSSQRWEWMCGATLIYDRWAITAAHCVTEYATTKLLNATNLKLIYGESTMKQSTIEKIVNNGIYKDKFSIENVFFYPGYVKETFDNDIALLQLKTPVKMGHLVGVACLPVSLECSNKRVVVGQEGVVTGWGKTMNGTLSEMLREVPLLVANKTECETYVDKKGYSDIPSWTDNMFCAQSESATQDTTAGDSGGPFVIQHDEGDDGEWVLEGVISWGVERYQHNLSVSCAPGANVTTSSPNTSDQPQQTRLRRSCYSGHTRVAIYLDWIETTTGVKPLPADKCNRYPEPN